MSFMGPHSRLYIRLNPDETPKENSLPVNKSDYESYLHDVAYKHAKEDYLKNPTQENKKAQMQKVWHADDKFVEAMKHDHEEPMAPVAGKLIQVKEMAEKMGAPTTFSGFGKNTEHETSENVDPVAKLRSLVKEQYKSELKKENNNKNKVQKGGFIPIIPVATAVVSTIASKLASELYDFLKKKITSSGSGTKIPYHRTKKEKIQFIKDIVDKHENYQDFFLEKLFSYKIV